MATATKMSIKNRNAAVQAGIDKHLSANVTLGGTTYAPTAMKNVFAAHSTAIDAADSLQKQWKDQLQVADDNGEEADKMYQLLQSYLVSQFGTKANSVLNDFGMQAPKAKGAKTVEVKAAAIAKTKATRAARHTMGKVQKKAVTGDVTGVIVTPVTVPTPAPTPEPSPTPGPAPTPAPSTSVAH